MDSEVKKHTALPVIKMLMPLIGAVLIVVGVYYFLICTIKIGSLKGCFVVLEFKHAQFLVEIVTVVVGFFAFYLLNKRTTQATEQVKNAQKQIDKSQQQIDQSERTHAETHLETLFNNAVGYFANSTLHVKQSGIRMLHEIAKEHADYRLKIYEIFMDCLRFEPIPDVNNKKDAIIKAKNSIVDILFVKNFSLYGSMSKDLRNADLRKIDFSSAKLLDADLFSANLECANLPRCQLQGAHLYKANLQGAHLRSANLMCAYLRQANLQGAVLCNTNLQCADLSHANLQAANLSDAKLQDAKFVDTQLQGAYDSLLSLETNDYERRMHSRDGKDTELNNKNVVFGGGLSQNDYDINKSIFKRYFENLTDITEQVKNLKEHFGKPPDYNPPYGAIRGVFHHNPLRNKMPHD